MERTLFLILAVLGYGVGGLILASGAEEIGAVALGAATASLLVWVIALGVQLGIKDALNDHGDPDQTVREAADRWRKARYGD